MYKLSYYRFGDLKLDYHTPAGFDRTRNVVIGHKDFDLTYLEEAYTTEHWLVRIYRLINQLQWVIEHQTHSYADCFNFWYWNGSIFEWSRPYTC